MTMSVRNYSFGNGGYTGITPTAAIPATLASSAVVICLRDSNTSIAQVSGWAGGGTWTRIARDTTSYDMEIWLSTDVPAGSTSWTASWSNGAYYPNFSVAEIIGAGAFDV